jgi:hypothetical protein
VGRALACTPDAVYVHEPDGVHEPFAFRARVRDGLNPQAVLAVGTDAPEYQRLWRGALAGGRQSRSIREQIARRAYRSVPAEVRGRARQAGHLPARLRLAMACATPLRPRTDAGTVVVKSVNAALAAEWLWERFHPRVLVVTRDLRNVVASWLEIGFGPPGQRAYDAMRRQAMVRWGVEVTPSGDAVERTATLCTVLLLALHDGIRSHPEWVWLVHEDSARDPRDSLARAAAALGLQWSDAADEFVERSNRPGAGYATNRVAEELAEQWKSRLGPDQLRAVDRVLEAFPEALWQVAERR